MTYICCFLAWAIVIGFCLSVGAATKDGISRLKRLHQIPCSGCAFFTGDYHLKCTVRPSDALTEQAIDCRDFEPRPAIARACQASRCHHCPTAQPAPRPFKK
ncbi:hypothetical protein [Myxacorys almedinensis]|uniref:Uncharacterized protein n=1 Tax=Myxacorys almedinensis A TaxID=2690445 RepID=A0A8J7Z537_9CYAN|nr:hypothetical protein [Myxacorys almedinensis]NDJ18263.1 hypothetical protein [Myxacorys almedinensis A]